MALDTEQEHGGALALEDVDGHAMSPDKKAQLAADTIASAMRSRTLLEIHWSVAAPIQAHRPDQPLRKA